MCISCLYLRVCAVGRRTRTKLRLAKGVVKMRSENWLLNCFALSSVLTLTSVMSAQAQGSPQWGWNSDPAIPTSTMYPSVPGMIITLTPQSPDSPVRWVLVSEGTTIRGTALPTVRTLHRVDPLKSPIKIVIPKRDPDRSYGSFVWSFADWVNRGIFLYCPSIESGERWINVSTSSGNQSVKLTGNFRKGDGGKPVLNTRQGDSANNTIITDSVISLTTPQVVGSPSYWIREEKGLEASAYGPSGNSYSDNFLFTPTWSNVSQWIWETWTARTPYASLGAVGGAAGVNMPPSLSPTSHSVSVSDAYGNMTSNYLIRWHLPLENATPIKSEDVPGQVTTIYQWDKTDYRFQESPHATYKQFTGIGYINGGLALLGALNYGASDVRLKLILVVLGIVANFTQPEDQPLSTTWEAMWHIAFPGVPVDPNSKVYKLSMNVGTIDLKDTFECEKYSESGYEGKENVCKQVFKYWDWHPDFTLINQGGGI